MAHAERRLKQLQGFLQPLTHWSPLLSLPDGSQVGIVSQTNDFTKIIVDGKDTLIYRPLDVTASLVLAAIGTPFERDNPVPKYPVLELALPEGSSSLSLSDAWASIYALWTIFHEQEEIPISFSSSFRETVELEEYVLGSGLGRKALDPSVHHIFLQRATFWQGAGQGPLWGIVERSWLSGTYGFRASTFPSVQSFTRSELVIAAHPHRPPKPAKGECVYRRYCSPAKKTLAMHAIDPENEAHMETFHRWMNDEVVNKGWGERGSMEKHRKYVEERWADPHVLPLMMSWDGELMGYTELTWIKEDHVAPFIPEGPWDWDRGLHVLVGETKFRGVDFSRCWFRSLTHYMFLADPRTLRVIGEPKKSNPAIIKTSLDAGMHLQTSFYFPYKNSVMTMNLRERFFKEDMLY